MRVSILIAATVLAVLSGSPAKAATWYPWCAWYDWTTSNCGFTSQRQCLATISGVGGTCRRNAAQPRRGNRRSEVPTAAPYHASSVPRAGEPARMIQLPNGRWVSNYGCTMDEGNGRFSDCNNPQHD